MREAKGINTICHKENMNILSIKQNYINTRRKTKIWVKALLFNENI